MRIRFVVAVAVASGVLLGAGTGSVSVAAPAAVVPAAGATAGEAELDQARRTGSPVVVQSQTTPTQLVTANPSGTFTAELTPGPVRVRGTDGVWRGVDPTLVRGADGVIAPRLTVTPMRLSGGGSQDLVQITDAGATLGLGWPHPLPAPVLSGSSATYPEVFPGADLVVRVGAEGFATYVVVKNRAAASDPRVRKIQYALRGSGLSTSAPDGDTLRVTDGTGRLRFEAGHAFMWDSRGSKPVPGASSEAATRRAADDRQSTARLAVSGEVLSVTPDVSLLDDPATVFPVVIDPAIQADREHTYWVSVTSAGTEYINSATEMARVGREWGGSFVARSFYRFSTSTFVGKSIKKATFSHKLIHSPNNDCNLATYGPGVRVFSSGAISSGTVWPGPALVAYSPTINAKAHGYSSYCSGYDRLDWDVKSIVDAAGSTLTLGMRSSDENDNQGWRKFDNDTTLNYPLLAVEYNSLPNTAGAPSLVGVTGSAAAGWWTTDSTPTFRSVVSDPDGTAGGQLTGLFNLIGGPDMQHSGSSVNSGGTSEWTVPATTPLVENVLYTAKVKAKDYVDLSAAWSPSLQFRVDLTNPTVPTVDPIGTVPLGSPVTFQASSTSTDVVAFCYGVKVDTTPTCESTTTSTSPTPITAAAPVSTAGPAWVSVVAKDAAGRVSTPVKVWFDVTAVVPNHRWRLDSSGTDSIGSLSLTPAGGAGYVTGATGAAPDAALSLNGSTQFAAGAGPAVATDTSFAVAAWVNNTSTTPATTTAAAVSQLGAQEAGFELGLVDGTPSFTVKTIDGTPGTFTVQSPNGPPDWANGWVHLAGSYSSVSDTISLFVDGELVADVQVTGDVFPAAGPVVVGRSQSAGSPGRFWPGAVDDVYTFPGVIDDNTVRQARRGE